ncbi:DUF1178 family protein [Litorimonas sp. WD9-15]|uniref:DUF1178 family protein n=1 Tax=Litorimonas sp. WD9-15 TaxID=3418716 RepID=UPI003CFC7487
MIRYTLICDHDHEFEGWFSSSSDYDDQAKSGLLTCPICESVNVEKAIMAPAIKTARKVEARSEKAKMAMNTVAAKIRDEISKNCEDVGDKFAEEARAIHYGEKVARGIYGSTTPEESASLSEEGIEAHPLPDILVPEKSKPKLN